MLQWIKTGIPLGSSKRMTWCSLSSTRIPRANWSWNAGAISSRQDHAEWPIRATTDSRSVREDYACCRSLFSAVEGWHPRHMLVFLKVNVEVCAGCELAYADESLGGMQIMCLCQQCFVFVLYVQMWFMVRFISVLNFFVLRSGEVAWWPDRCILLRNWEYSPLLWM